ncbi:gluconate:H+ symporter, GntP family protein [Longimycelium tulufanense]|uniref:Gluconate:H+ symporter, GntP family protein n=1 Tax=Longimycelium tulufanense TaxID=907463 RepID=A0A8J3CHK6_9PSEU|nr:gluconate:H+ symporter [Longimycelium tulufanense]GGM70603.1 gluconate:H+ symporter, GntP family protein [Longimycelium tulufanense]
MDGVIGWLRHDTAGLLTLCIAGIALLLFLIIRVRTEPFIALIVTGLLVALAAGLPVERIIGSAQGGKESLLEGGFGGILGHVTAIIGLGTLLGSVLEASGGAEVLTRRLLGLFGARRAPLVMGLSGLVFGVPVFFDIGIFVLAPLVYVAARRSGRSILLFCLPLLAGLSVTHAFLPPHPGPVALAGLLKVDVGWLIVMGLACAVPAWAAGLLFSSWVGRRLHIPVPQEMVAAAEHAERDNRPEPALALVAAIIATPLVLILGATFGGILLPEGSAVSGVLTFLGSPTVALTVAVLLAIWLLGLQRGMSRQEIGELAAKSLRPVGMILLVVGAGGFFGVVLSATGVGKALAGTLSSAGLPLIVLAYVISCGLRLAQGSATVAIVTTGGIMAPLLVDNSYSQPQLALLAVSIAAGSIIASHVNDGGFWIVSRYFGIPVKETLKTWTALETILSVVGFAVAAVLSLVI